jgi:signal transduction histidine kinase
MAAAQAVRIESPIFLQDENSVHSPEDAVRDLVHELRQPLSSIEAIAYYLEMTLPADQFLARHYVRRIQQLVEETTSSLGKTASDFKRAGGPA